MYYVPNFHPVCFPEWPMTIRNMCICKVDSQMAAQFLSNVTFGVFFCHESGVFRQII